jgi:hypothetical protein
MTQHHSDHAQLYFMSPAVNVIDPEGENLNFLKAITAEGRDKVARYFPNCDRHRAMDGNLHRSMATNIYPTKDGRYYHTHGMMSHTSQCAI